MNIDRRGADKHDQYLGTLYVANQPRFLIFIGNLTGGRREQEERENKQAGGDIDESVDIVRVAELKRDEDQQYALVHVVIKRPKKLGRKKCGKALIAQQRELTRRCYVFVSRTIN